jgi:hypothetical protein
MSSTSKKLAIAALAGLMTVGLSSAAFASANPYPQGYKGNSNAVATETTEAKASCNAASCNAKTSCKGAKPAKKHHAKKHHVKHAAPAAAPAAAAPAKAK